MNVLINSTTEAEGISRQYKPICVFSLLANGRKLMAWPGVVFVVVVVNNFFQPLLLRNYCTDFFEILYGASLGRGLSFFLIVCFSTNQRRSHDQKHVFQKGVLVWMIT